jgi:hypothetical protein
MSEHLAHVMEQAPPLGQCLVEVQLGRHGAGQPGYLLRMIQDVLPVRSPVAHASDQLDQFRMQAVYSGIIGGLFSQLDQLTVQLRLDLLNDLLDPARVNATVGDQRLQRPAGDFPSDWVEARDDDGIRGIVDDDVHAGGRLEGPDVTPLASDDPALHLVTG